MPVLAPYNGEIPKIAVPFNICKYEKEPADKMYHFYVDDIHFERFWNNPSKYLSVLSNYSLGITPDYSMYIDMPRPQQIWNCWRNRAIAYWMQSKGLNVIPNACWGDMSSLEWAFDGLPENSIIAVTTQGCMRKSGIEKFTLVNGLHELIRRKHPTRVVIYGNFPDEWRDRFPVPIIVINSYSKEKWGNNNG